MSIAVLNAVKGMQLAYMSWGMDCWIDRWEARRSALERLGHCFRRFWIADVYGRFRAWAAEAAALKGLKRPAIERRRKSMAIRRRLRCYATFFSASESLRHARRRRRQEEQLSTLSAQHFDQQRRARYLKEGWAAWYALVAHGRIERTPLSPSKRLLPGPTPGLTSGLTPSPMAPLAMASTAGASTASSATCTSPSSSSSYGSSPEEGTVEGGVATSPEQVAHKWMKDMEQDADQASKLSADERERLEARVARLEAMHSRKASEAAAQAASRAANPLPTRDEASPSIVVVVDGVRAQAAPGAVLAVDDGPLADAKLEPMIATTPLTLSRSSSAVQLVRRLSFGRRSTNGAPNAKNGMFRGTFSPMPYLRGSSLPSRGTAPSNKSAMERARLAKSSLAI